MIDVEKVSDNLYGVMDVLRGVQVGWLRRGPAGNEWFVLNNDEAIVAGPYVSRKRAAQEVPFALKSEFGVGSPAN
ncbi:MAG: hypothetical protein O9248_00645 [Rhodobacteraceae bacterium]|nr:hypothetical protein [Paracoccaceae bacterium]